MTYNLTTFERYILNKYYKLHVNRMLGKKTFLLPHHLLIREFIKKRLSYKIKGKYKEGSRYISETFFGFNVGKYSYGYEQFWGKNNNGRYLKSIGAFTAIANNVTIAAGNHPTHYISLSGILYDKQFGFVNDNYNWDVSNKNGKVVIGNDVWIGCNVTILPGVTIGDGAVIGAGAIVTKDVNPYSIVTGIPAKHLKYRFTSEQRTHLLKEHWWDMPDSEIKNRLPLMYSIHDFIKNTDT